MSQTQLAERPPDNIRRLPHDGDSFVPWFAIGQPARRPMPWPHPQQARALAGGRCWLCGRTRGEQATFLTSLRGALEREARDPPCHWPCAIYAATVWMPGGRLGWFPPDRELEPRLTWLSSPDDERRGIFGNRVVCLWRTDRWQNLARSFRLHEPSAVGWYEQGHPINGIAFDPDDYLGALAQRGKLAPLIERLKPWLP